MLVRSEDSSEAPPQTERSEKRDEGSESVGDLLLHRSSLIIHPSSQNLTQLQHISGGMALPGRRGGRGWSRFGRNPGNVGGHDVKVVEVY